MFSVFGGKKGGTKTIHFELGNGFGGKKLNHPGAGGKGSTLAFLVPELEISLAVRKLAP